MSHFIDKFLLILPGELEIGSNGWINFLLRKVNRVFFRDLISSDITGTHSVEGKKNEVKPT